MFDDIFAEFPTRVKASLSTPKDAKGISRKLKFDAAPDGSIDDDDAWIAAASEGDVTLTETMKQEDGKGRSKSLKLDHTDEEESARAETATRRVLGIEERKRRRSNKADTLPSENGKAEEVNAN